MNVQATTKLPPESAREPATQPRVVIIGAGMSGILMAIKLLASGHRNFRVYEKAARLGGTWRENSYPNLACDVFAPGYAYSFEPNSEWNYRFGRGAEILGYFERVAHKYGLEDFISFDNGVESARWDGTHWQIRTVHGATDEAALLVSAVGALHHPRYPDIAGLASFAGPCFHTARWDHQTDIRGKRVGVIGTGSTAAQVIPGIVDTVGELYLFQRTPQWMFPMADKNYSEAFKDRRRRHPWIARLHHWVDLWLFGFFSRAVLGNRWLLDMIEKQCRKNLDTVRDPELRRKLTPDYPPACKRLVISDQFYPAIQKSNAHLVTEGIESIVPEGVVTRDGKRIDLEVLVLSTGFYPYKTSVDVTGEGGKRLDDVWAGSPLLYRSVGVPGFPNYFVLFGPYSPIGNMSIIENSEIQAAYIMRCVELVKSGAIKAMNPKESVTRALKQEMLTAIKQTAWAGGCKSWYLDANGDAIGYPYQFAQFRRELSAPVLEEFDLTTA